MCQFASFIFKPDTMEVRIADLNHHAQTYERLGLKDGPEPDGWREGHYMPSGEIQCRVIDGDSVTATHAVEIVRAQWSTFPKFFEWAVSELGGVVGDLDLSSYAHPLPAAIQHKDTRPKSVVQK